MNLSRAVLGAYVVQALTDKATAPLLTIGSDVFFRHDFAQIDCFNFTAAANLSRVLKALRVKHCRDLFDRVPPSDLLLPRLGAVSLAVLGAAFELKGIGGDAPLEKWMANHQGKDEVITFGTMKHRTAKKPAKRSRYRYRRQASAQPSAHVH